MDRFEARLRRVQERNTVLRERDRIARDLHDGMSHLPPPPPRAEETRALNLGLREGLDADGNPRGQAR